MGFWQAADDEYKKKNITGKTKGDDVQGFFTKSLPSFASGAMDAATKGVLTAGADIVNGIGTGFNQNETKKRTDDFIKSAGFKDDGTSNLTVNTDPNARAAGSVAGGVTAIPAAIADSVVSSAGQVGNTLGTALGTALGISEDTAKKHRETVDSIDKMRSQLLDSVGGKGPVAPGTMTVDQLTPDQKKLYDGMTNKIKEIQDKESTRSKDEQQSLNPTKFASNAVDTVLNLTGIGEIKNVAKAGEATAKVANEGLKIKSGFQKANEAVANSKLGGFFDAATNPQSFKQGAATFGAQGALSGGLNEAADNPNATPLSIAENTYKGGALGAIVGGIAGKGGKEAPVTGPQPIGTMTQDAKFNTATAQFAESMGPPKTPAMTVNGEGGASRAPNLDPWSSRGANPVETPNAPNAQPIAQNAPQPGIDSQNPLQNAPISMEDMDLLARKPTDTKLTDAQYLESVKAPVKADDYKTMNADVTPGANQTMEVKLPQEDLDQLKQHISGMKPAEAEKTLRSLGADDATIQSITGNAPGVTKKMRPVTDEAPTGPAPLETQLTDDLKVDQGSLPGNVEKAVNDIGDSTGTLSGDYVSAPTKGQKVLDTASKELDNVSNTTSKMAGKVGADFADKMQGGARLKAQVVDDTVENVDAIEKHLKDTNLTVPQQKQSTARVVDAIENGNKAALKEEDKTLYDNITKMLDRFKAERVKQGREVKDNYVMHVNLDKDSSKAGSIADALFGNKDPDMLSMFSKKRGEESKPVENLYEMARKYQQGMANDLAYHDAQKYLAGNLENIPAYLANNPKNMAEFKSYVSDLLDHARNGSSENVISRGIAKYAIDPFTDNVLRFNIGNSLKNFTDQIRTGAVISKEAKAINVPSDMLDEFYNDGLNFKYGNDTKAEVGQNATRQSKIGTAVDKISPNMITEKLQVKGNAKKGLQEGFAKSEVYQKAKASGMSDEAAMQKAWKEDRPNVERTANYVAGTSSAGNAMQQVAALRNGKPLLGIVPWSAVTRFASFPITNTMNFVRNMKPAEARAIEAYARGDIMGSKLADIRGNSKTLLDMYSNAAKQTDSGIPKEVLDAKIQSIKKAIEVIDGELAKGSRISKGNTAQTYAKIWGATVAIQMAVVGTQDAAFNRTGKDAKQKSILGTALTQSPFLDVNRVINPIVNGSPVQSSYGQPSLNAKGIVNAIPYAGGVDNATGNNLSSWLNDNIVKPTNKEVRSAYN